MKIAFSSPSPKKYITSSIAITLFFLSLLLFVHKASASNTPQVSAGGFHTAVLKSVGTVWTWGNNTYGQLGDGMNTDSTSPVMTENLNNIIAIACGYWHTAALKSDGTVWTWGNNTYGQLGDGTNTHRNTPVQVSDLSDVVFISCGYWHTAALKSDGTVWTWGNNTYGQLGDGTYSHSNTPLQVTDLGSDVKTYISGIGDLRPLACGYWHTLALKSDLTVWAWGNNSYGQLGNDSTTDSTVPVQVSDISSVTAVSGGYWHSLVLKSDRTVWAWGNNAFGQVGIGSGNVSIITPFEVKLNPPEVTTGNATDITDSSAALTGTVNARGLKTSAWFEYDTSRGSYSSSSATEDITGIDDTAIQITISDLDSNTTYYYRLVAKNDGGTTYGAEKSFTTSSASSAAATQIKFQSEMSGLNSELVANSPFSSLLVISGGGLHSIYLGADGSVWACGSNYDGQLGNGTNEISYSPGLAQDISGAVTAVAGGLWHTVAMRSDGTVWTWGSNYNGQLGDGTYDAKNTPVQVQNINLIQASSNIYGYVKDTSGNPIEDAIVALAKRKTKILEKTSSDANGYFQFENLVSGKYLIQTRKKGYKQGRSIIKLEAGENKEIEIEMKQTNE